MRIRMFPVNRNQLNPKGPFADRWAGPWRIRKWITEQFYCLKLSLTEKNRFCRVFHASQLKLFVARRGTRTPIVPGLSYEEFSQVNDQALEPDELDDYEAALPSNAPLDDRLEADDFPDQVDDLPLYHWGDPTINV